LVYSANFFKLPFVVDVSHKIFWWGCFAPPNLLPHLSPSPLRHWQQQQRDIVASLRHGARTADCGGGSDVLSSTMDPRATRLH